MLPVGHPRVTHRYDRLLSVAGTPQWIRSQLPALKSALQGRKRAVVGTHMNPDGDALGSALAFSLWLDQIGLEHEVVCQDPPPANLAWLPNVNRILQAPTQKADIGIVVDLEAMSRLGRVATAFEGVDALVVIDHHVPMESPGDLRIVSTQSPATAAILCDLFFDADVEITREMATCLATGIVTDTGSFRYSNTTSHSLHLVARLLEAGARLADIAEAVYMSRRLPAARLTGHVLANMNLECEGRLAWVVVPNDVFERYGATDQDTEGLANELLSVETVQAAAVLREHKPGKIRGSLRSRSQIDVAGVAQQFGGGGHKNAAGVSFDGDIDEAERQLVEALKACLVCC